ncbi:MAG: 2-amino-4-hydroxy-6-hydroxymethyldihydropteridine diphosphokinase [Mariprofundales bacterium]
MAMALISIGSNIQPEMNLMQAAVMMRSHFFDTKFSNVYRGKAIGLATDNAADFLNACCTINSELSQSDLITWLKDLEVTQGRDDNQGSDQSRTLDLDVIMYDGNIIRASAFSYAYVMIPAAEIMDLPDHISKPENTLTQEFLFL